MSFLFKNIVVRAHVPRMTLDELFEQKGDVAKAVLEELEKVSLLLVFTCVIMWFTRSTLAYIW